MKNPYRKQYLHLREEAELCLMIGQLNRYKDFDDAAKVVKQKLDAWNAAHSCENRMSIFQKVWYRAISNQGETK